MTDTTPNTLLLRPRRLKWLLILAICIAFTVGGVFQIRAGQSVGWLAVLFFGLGVLASVGGLLPNSAYLRLTPDGFESRSLFRSSLTRWADVSSFEVGLVGANKMVVFNYAPSYRRSAKARAFASMLSGFEAAIPDTYGHTVGDLAALLNEWRARAMRGCDEPSVP